jgi:galactokinase
MTSSKDVTSLFQNTFDAQTAGVWSAPGRVNLIGEHTDYTGGFVMPFAISQRAFVAVSPRTDGIVRAVARGRGAGQIAIRDVELGKPSDWLGYLAGAAWVADANNGWDIALASDVPIGGGLSSSAAITCAILLAMNDLSGWNLDRQELARLAQRVEHEVIGIPCGIMDQTASFQCIAGHVLMLDTRSLQITQVPWIGEERGLSLLVSDTQTPHQLVDGQYAMRRRSCEEAAVKLGVHQLRDADFDLIVRSSALLTDEEAACARHVTSENARVLQVRDLLEAGEPERIGPFLTASHASLRDDLRVTVPQLDITVTAALDAGALGSRMTGGGFGGCTLTLVTSDRVAQVQQAIDSALTSAGFISATHFVTTPAAGAACE